MEQSFVVLVEQAQQGDRQAFEKLYNYYHEVLRNHIRDICSRNIMPEDVIQDTFLLVWMNLNKLKNTNSFHSWIKKIARNVTYRYVKKEKHHRVRSRWHPAHNDPTETLEKGTWESNQSYLLKNISSCEKNPMEAVTQRDECEHVRRAVNQLPPKYQDVVKAHYFEAQSIAEIAQIKGKPEGTIKRWLHEAYQMMKEMLAT